MLRTARGQLWRICRIGAGFLLLLAGLFLSLPGVPGPGIVLVVLSFGILSRDFKWAVRWHIFLKQKAQDFMNRLMNRLKSKKQQEQQGSRSKLMDDKDHLSNKIRDKGKADEDQYFAKRDRELLEKLKKKEQEKANQGPSLEDTE